MSEWRDVLTETERFDLDHADVDWFKADMAKKDASKRRRAIYLRAKKRIGRAQNSVDMDAEHT